MISLWLGRDYVFLFLWIVFCLRILLGLSESLALGLECGCYS